MTEMDVAGLRLRNQRISQPANVSSEKLVAWFGAVQAQEYGPAKWGLALRSKSATTDVTIARAIDRGRILRTHVLRPTWHFVTHADIRWMLELTGPRIQRLMANYDRRLGLDAKVMTRATAVFERALGEHRYLTRRELGAHIQRGGLPSGSMNLAHMAMYAELEGVICSGPRRGKQSTYALLAERAPDARRLERDEALAELVRRYFRSHGPATIRDFGWWSGLTTADTKRGLEIVGARRRAIDGLIYWTVGRDPATGARSTSALHLLPIYDEYLVAYRDHHIVPRPAYALGNFQHALVIGGQVAGTWRTSQGIKGIDVAVQALRPLSSAERRALGQAVARYRRFLGVPASLSAT